jgi:hypothetical protein
LANGPDSRRDVAFRSSELGAAPDTMERRAAEIAQKSAGRPMTPSEISSWWTRRTFAERGPAAEWTTHVARKAVLFWSAEETPNNHDAAVEREWSVWLRFAPMSAWWLVAAGLAGWWIARRRAPALDVAALTIVITWAALAVFFPLTRYKMPAATVAAVAAAAGTAEILTRRVSWRVAAVAALAMVAAMRASVVAYSPVSHASGMHNIAFAFDHAGMRAEAETYLRRYLAEDPDDGPALEKLGRLLVDDGRPEEGLVLLRRAAQDGRTRWTASAGAVHALVVLGRGIAAELEGVELLAEEPSIPAARAELLADLALAAAATGDASRAEERIRAAEALDAAAPGVVRARAILSR